MYELSFQSDPQFCGRGLQGNLASTMSRPWLASPSALEIKGAAVAMMGEATSRDSVETECNQNLEDDMPGEEVTYWLQWHRRSRTSKT